MLVGNASVIGNEVLTAALSAWTMFLLLRCLAEPSALRLVLALGATSGLALLTKFNSLAVLGAAGTVFLVRGFREEGRQARQKNQPSVIRRD